MKYSQLQIKEKLTNLCMKDLKTGKNFYSLKDVFKDFNIKHFEIGLIATTHVFKKMDLISYPCRTLYTLKKNPAGITEDVYLNPVGLMLVLGMSSKLLKNDSEKEICHDIANVIKQEQPTFYPERRLLYRNEYKENFF